MATTTDHLIEQARSRIRSLDPAQVEANLFTDDALLVDVREPEELDEHGLIAGAFHVPRGLLERWADDHSPHHRGDFVRDRRTILYSGHGDRSALAAATLHDLGFTDVAHLDGGLAAWVQAGLPVVGLKSWHVHA